MALLASSADAVRLTHFMYECSEAVGIRLSHLDVAHANQNVAPFRSSHIRADTVSTIDKLTDLSLH